MIPRGQLAEVAEPRYEELFRLVRAELRRSGLEELVAAGVVLTGGAAKMEGVVPLAEEVFEMPVRLGTARHIAGSADFLDDPAHAAAAGLLLYGREARMEYRPEPKSERGEQGVWQRFHHWLRDLF
jgi:cell division protein FtsA